MEIIGKIVEFTPIETGTSEKGTWKRRQVIIKTLDQNPQHIALTAIGARLDEAEKHNIGEIVRARFGVSSRKIYERWFSDILLWEINQVR